MHAPAGPDQPGTDRAKRIAWFLPAAAVVFLAALALLLVLAIPGDSRDGRRERPTHEVVAPRPTQPPPPVLTPLQRAVADLRAKDSEVRTKAESYLIARRDSARLALDGLVRRALPARTKASLRYLEAVWAEQAGGALPAPLTVRTAPTRGLVHLIDEWTAEAADRLACIRRTGAAERLPVTLVYTGGEHVDRLLARHSYEMGPVAFFHDAKDTLARRWGIRHKPATAGLDRNGRLAFLHVGPLDRASLSERTGKLRGD